VCVDDDDLILSIMRYGITNYENEVRRFEEGEEEENKKWEGKR
jgi:response regulator RpfG family c-di-GMP phosphodiesterase